MQAGAALLIALALAVSGTVALAVRAGIASWLSSGLPEDALVISRAHVALGPFALGGGAMPMELIPEISADPGVSGVAVEEALTVPARVLGNIAGHPYGSDVAVLGVDSACLAWLAPDIDPAMFIDREPLPVLVPDLILDAYNNAFAEANGLPRLEAGAFVGRGFSLEAGASSLGDATSGSVKTNAVIAGFAHRGDLLGVIVPLAYARRMNAAFAGGEARRLIVFPRSPRDAVRLEETLKDRGYDVSAPAERARQLARLDGALATGFVMLAALLGFLGATASLTSSAAFLLAHRDEAELLHQLAVPRFSIIAHFTTRIAGLAAIFSFVGAMAGTLAAATAQPLLSTLLHGASKSPTPFTLVAVMLIAFLVPTLASLLGSTAAGLALIPRWSER